MKIKKTGYSGFLFPPLFNLPAGRVNEVGKLYEIGKANFFWFIKMEDLSDFSGTAFE